MWKLLLSTWIVSTAAARVLSKEVHALQNTDLRVRKAACKDRCRLLLRGFSPSTSVDFLELYVENSLGLNLEEYELYFPPARDSVLIQLRQPLSQGDSSQNPHKCVQIVASLLACGLLLDFQTLSAKISQRPIDGASMTLEEIEQTDSVLVGKLHPSTSPEMLSMYFEARGGNQMVMAVTKLSESTAKVSFVDYGCKFCIILLLLHQNPESRQSKTIKGADKADRSKQD